MKHYEFRNPDGSVQIVAYGPDDIKIEEIHIPEGLTLVEIPKPANVLAES